MLETLGNVTLVTPEFNRKLSNRDFKTKKKEIRRSNQCELQIELRDLAAKRQDDGVDDAAKRLGRFRGGFLHAPRPEPIL